MKKYFLISFSLLLAACETNQIVDPVATNISLSIQNLPPLEGAHYQIWATFYQFNKAGGTDGPMHDGEFVSLGEFAVSQDGSLRSLSGGEARFGLPAGSDPQLLKDIVIAVQADHHDALSKPHHDEPGSIVMGGAFHGDAATAMADMHIAYADAFRTTFASVSGKSTIVCPTSPADSNSGVWFAELGTPITTGLKNMPPLPPEWRYEGWVMRPDIVTGGFTYWSTGKFARADSADLDGAGPNSGTGSPLNFPGQDFVSGSTVPNNLLTGGYSFMVTIEPFPDNSAKPFFLVLLSTLQAVPPSTGRVFTMQNIISQTTPTAQIVIKR